MRKFFAVIALTAAFSLFFSGCAGRGRLYSASSDISAYQSASINSEIRSVYPPENGTVSSFLESIRVVFQKNEEVTKGYGFTFILKDSAGKNVPGVAILHKGAIKMFFPGSTGPGSYTAEISGVGYKDRPPFSGKKTWEFIVARPAGGEPIPVDSTSQF